MFLVYVILDQQPRKTNTHKKQSKERTVIQKFFSGHDLVLTRIDATLQTLMQQKFLQY